MPLRIAKHKKDQATPNPNATQLLVHSMVISCLDYCNALLTGPPACAVKPLQMVKKAAGRLVFDQPKRAHITHGSHLLECSHKGLRHDSVTQVIKGLSSSGAYTTLNYFHVSFHHRGSLDYLKRGGGTARRQSCDERRVRVVT